MVKYEKTVEYKGMTIESNSKIAWVYHPDGAVFGHFASIAAAKTAITKDIKACTPASTSY